ncbi:MAG: hypothetical protein BEN19_01920 [Epulopiscium sp. Nuni2H_MBin003]|nr:MAG: hypothetical protein BEN19_01920 [Epulopiscium sp. Nuni2H_MBin003]
MTPQSNCFDIFTANLGHSRSVMALCSKLLKFHIEQEAAYGTTVIAAADGKVITSGWVNGFGYTIMVDHGGGLVTLYAHNSSLHVKVGQMVKQGDKVAGVGSTGFSTGNHCHFEVRINGTHTNPWNYLGARP